MGGGWGGGGAGALSLEDVTGVAELLGGGRRPLSPPNLPPRPHPGDPPYARPPAPGPGAQQVRTESSPASGG